MLSTKAWGWCNDDLFKTETMEFCSDEYIVISFFNESCNNVVLLVAHFIHLLVSIHPLSMMSLLHTIHRFFYYWAQPIANDVIVIGLARKVIYYLVNVSIRLSFLFNCPNYTYYLCIVPLLVSDYFSWFVLSVCDKKN